jgi:predicted RNase H-like nuclease
MLVTKCPHVDADCSLAVATDQLVCFYTALFWVTWPTERVGYVAKITTGEMRTLTLASSIYSTNCTTAVTEIKKTSKACQDAEE